MKRKKMELKDIMAEAGEEMGQARWKKRYETRCPVCSKIFFAGKSRAMDEGYNVGCVTCPHCGTLLRTIFDSEAQTMEAEPFKNWIEKVKEELRK